MITPLGNNILISILPEGLGYTGHQGYAYIWQTKIFPSEEEILWGKKTTKKTPTIFPPFLISH